MVSSIFGCKALALQSSSRAPLGGIRQEAVKDMFAACNAHEFLATIPFLTALVCSTVFDDKHVGGNSCLIDEEAKCARVRLRAAGGATESE